ncbi:hypothetical protein C8R46DRAFT_1307999 [Mycena filopes]|nr:hypothetical protein C8R46DRAFT_1307999 [Mycena filopes]
MPGVKPSSKGKKTKPNESKERVDESLWRASTIDPNRTISATHAVSQYRLTSGVLKLLPFTTSQVTLPYQQRTVTMTLYKEQAVERLAWVDQRRLTRISICLRNGTTPAKYPRRLRPTDEQGRLWLWEAANDILAASANEFGDERLSAAEKQVALADPFLVAPNAYPPRPAALAPGSPSYDRLREVLTRAPSKHDPKTRGQLEIHENMFEGVTMYYWNHAYMVELFSSLIAVIEEHGIEGIGWKSARWEVYHTYSRCIKSLYFSYEDKCWCDDAQDWLCGRMDLPGSRTITTRQDNQSDVGRTYNQMLPFLEPGE